jgi:GT2 family glycosyltransferase
METRQLQHFSRQFQLRMTYPQSFDRKPDARPVKVSVVLVSYNSEHLIDELFAHLHPATRSVDWECIAVDNASRDRSAEKLLAVHPDTVLIRNKVNVGFGRANNQALPFIKGDYVLLLNTDAFVEDDTLTKTIAYMDEHPECGVLGVRLTDRDGTLQPSARYFPTPLNLFLQRTGLSRLFPGVRMVDDMGWDHKSVRDCDWVPGCYLLIRKSVIDQVRLFDPRFFLYYEEVDFCHSAKRAGWLVRYFPDTSVIHIGGESAKSDGEISSGNRQLIALQMESELLYIRKNHGLPGLLMHVGLWLASEMVSALRGIRHMRIRHAFGTLVHRIGLQWRLLNSTKLGSCGTR